jgi:tetratricopeptide (TPR) repeat protein
MRYAVVVAPPRFVLPAEGSVFAAAEPVGPMCAMLARGGRRVLLVQTTPDLATDFARAVAEVSANDDLVVYMAASTTTHTDAVELRVGDEADAPLARPDRSASRERGQPPTVALGPIGEAVAARAPSAVLLVIEACHDGDADDPMLAAEHVDAILRAFDARAHGYGAAIGVRPESRAKPGAWPFTRHLLATLDDPASRDERGLARISLVHELLRAGGAISEQVQSFAFVHGHIELAIVEPSELSRDTRASVPPLAPADTSPLESADSAVLGLGAAAGEAADTASDLAPAPGDVPSGLDSGAPQVADRPSGLDPTAAQAVDLPSDLDPAAAPTVDPTPAPPERAPHLGGPAETDPEAPPATPPSPAPAVAAIPEPRRTEPSLPAIEPLLDLADDARERGALPEALAGYKAALMVAGPNDASARASIYARIGELKRAQGRPREAELNFEKALAVDPTQHVALNALVELATESKEVRRAVDLRRKRLRVLLGADERVDELRAISDAFAHQLQDASAAAEALDQALAIEGKSRTALEGLRAAYENLQRWPRVVEVLTALAETAEGAKEKGALRFAAADIALGRMRDEPRGLELLEQALQDDPTHDKALRGLITVRTSRSEWEAIERVYSRLVESFAGLRDTERAWDTCRKLGVLRRDKLHNLVGAVEAFTGAVHFKPENVDSRALLAEIHLAVGDEPRAVNEFERIAQYAPTRSSTYSRLFGLHRRAGRIDRAWLAGAALVELGTADMDQQLFVDQYRPDGPIRPTRSLDDPAWDELLRAPGADDVVAGVLRAIVATAVATRVDELRHARKLVTLDPARRQSATSTVSVVRSFHWAAQVLSVEPPDLYVMDDVPGGIAAVQSAAPTTALGPDVLRGLTTKDLAFLAGRHLTYFRPEHYSLICYPTLNDLSVLFLGAVKLVLPDLEAPAHLRDAVVRKRKVLARHASDDEKRRLDAAVQQLEARDGRVDLAAWIRNVELTAQRAGLLLCGDLAVGTARLRAEVETRAIAELTFDEKRGDLLAFSTSDKFARARALLGVSAHTSVSVPPAGELQTG